MHMPVNKPNVNCTYDSSHGTDEIYPKGPPPHIYILYMYDYLQEIVILHIYAQLLEKQLHILGNPYFCAGIKWD